MTRAGARSSRWVAKEDDKHSSEQEPSVFRLSHQSQIPLMLVCHDKRRGRASCSNLARVPRDGEARQAIITTLKLIVAPGDEGEEVVTILPPDDDYSVTCRY